jgi:hypothetical protein
MGVDSGDGWWFVVVGHRAVHAARAKWIVGSDGGHEGQSKSRGCFAAGDINCRLVRKGWGALALLGNTLSTTSGWMVEMSSEGS